MAKFFKIFIMKHHLLPLILLISLITNAQNDCKTGRHTTQREADATALDPRSDSINIRH
jgi:hypothetical protein